MGISLLLLTLNASILILSKFNNVLLSSSLTSSGSNDTLSLALSTIPFAFAFNLSIDLFNIAFSSVDRSLLNTSSDSFDNFLFTCFNFLYSLD